MTMYERTLQVKERLDTMNADFFENWMNYFIQANREVYDPAFWAVVKAGLLVEDFHGWNFQLPATSDAVKMYHRDNGRMEMPVMAWSQDGNASEHLVGFRSQDPTLRRFFTDCGLDYIVDFAA